MKSKIILAIFGVLTWITGARTQCGPGQTETFARWAGGAGGAGAPLFVYAAGADERSLTGACVARCRALPGCGGVAVVYGKGSCYGVAAAEGPLQLEQDVSYFQKVCLNVPAECADRWWAVEVTPGHRLGAAPARLLQNTTLEECYAAVLAPTDGQRYRSGQWLVQESRAGAAGVCALTSEDKFTEPESYRVASFQTFYVENQCRHDYSKKIERCSYEEYFNQTLKHVDYTHSNQTKDECRTSCEHEARFVCRGFSWSPAPGRAGPGGPGGPRGPGGRGLCDLHSQDLVSAGSWLLRRTTTASYYRRVICLNITVECNSTHLSVTYTPRTPFRGLLYVPGAAGAAGAAGAGAGPCGAAGRGGPVSLVLPMHGDCEVSFAYAVGKGPGGDVNRTLAYVLLSVQHHPIIQTAGDRWVRAGCSPGRRPTTVAAAVAVTDRGGAGGGGGGASAVYAAQPAAALWLVRAADAPGAAPALGETVELRIESQDENELEAYHAVAASRLGDSSVLLLDHRGCPTGQVDFPPFTRSWSGGTQRLSARFKAFRFPASPLVRFTVLVRPCDGRCPDVTCQPTQRSARNANTTDCPLGVSPPPGVNPPPGQALQVEMLVTAQDVMSADTLVRADHREPMESRDTRAPAGEAAGGAAGDAALVCVHELVLVALALGWLAVQALLVVGGAVVVKRYRALAELSLHKDYQAFDTSPAPAAGSTHRRVHWPDQYN